MFWRQLCLIFLLGVACAPVPRLVQLPPNEPEQKTIPMSVRQQVETSALQNALRGLYFLHTGQSAAAVPYLRMAIHHKSQSVFLAEKLIYAWIRAGNPQQALTTLEWALKQHPERAALHLIAGQMALKQQKYPKALQHLTLVLDDPEHKGHAYPDYVATLLWLQEKSTLSDTIDQLLSLKIPFMKPEQLLHLANILEEHNQLELAHKIYHKTRMLTPTLQEAAWGEIRVLELMRKPKQAADVIIALFAYFPDDPTLYAHLAQLLFDANKPEYEKFIYEAKRKNNLNPYQLSSIVQALVYIGKHTQAQDLLQSYQQNHPQDAAMLLLLGKYYLQNQQTNKCVSLFQTNDLELSSDAHSLLAQCALHEKKIDLSISQWKKMLAKKVKPRALLLEIVKLLRINVTYNVAKMIFQSLGYEASTQLTHVDRMLLEAHLAAAYHDKKMVQKNLVQLRPVEITDPDHSLQFAELEAAFGDSSRAIDIMKKLVLDDADNPYYLNTLAYTQITNQTNMFQASVWIRRAFRLNWGNPYITDTLAWLYYKQGKFQNALYWLHKVHQNLPHEPEVLFHLAKTHCALEQYPQAKRYSQQLQSISFFSKTPLSTFQLTNKACL